MSCSSPAGAGTRIRELAVAFENKSGHSDWLKTRRRPTRLTYRHIGCMSWHMIERTTIRLPSDLLDRAKRKAAAEGRTLTSLIEDGLRWVLAEKPSSAKKKPVLPPVSKATGGLMPGVDLIDLSTLQEGDDLDYLERTRRGT